MRGSWTYRYWISPDGAGRVRHPPDHDKIVGMTSREASAVTDVDFGGYRLQTVDGAQAPVSEIEQMWRLRMATKVPPVDYDLEAEWIRFLRFSRTSDGIIVARNSRTDIVGFADWQVLSRSTDGGGYPVIDLRHLYVAPGSRPGLGGALAVLAGWNQLNADDAERVYWCVNLSLPGYVVLSSLFPVWSMRNRALPDWARELVEQAGRRSGYRWHPGDGLIEQRVGRDVPDRLPESDHGRAARERYLDLNPRWREGWQLAAVAVVERADCLAHLRRLLPNAE